MLRAGLAASPWVSVDDTSARHQARGGFCTHIGNDWFPWFGTRESNSRLNFLDLLRGGEASLVLNDAAFDDMRRRALPAALIARLPNSCKPRLPIKPRGQHISNGLASRI